MKLTRKRLISEGLRYHVSKGIPLHDNIYRVGSEMFFRVISESRKLYQENTLSLNEFDQDIVNSDMGEYGQYDGTRVPLDLPFDRDWETEITLKNISDPTRYILS